MYIYIYIYVLYYIERYGNTVNKYTIMEIYRNILKTRQLLENMGNIGNCNKYLKRKWKHIGTYRKCASMSLVVNVTDMGVAFAPGDIFPSTGPFYPVVSMFGLGTTVMCTADVEW